MTQDRSVVDEASTAAPIPVPTDGTWDHTDSTAAHAAGFGGWSNREENWTFEFMIDTAPVVMQHDNVVVIESNVNVRRVNDNSNFDLTGIYASFAPGVSLLDESGNLRYDEAYGRSSFDCPVDDLSVGDVTTCVVSFTVGEDEADWLQDSHWHIDSVSVAAWPGQTTTP